MKHDIFDGNTCKPVAGGNSSHASALSVHLISSVLPDGSIGLAGISAESILSTQHFGQDAVGSFAVCSELAGHAGTLVVLGHVSLEAVARAFAAGVQNGEASSVEKPLLLKCGRSHLHLHQDGRIRIVGDDVLIESNGRLGLRGAIVDLN